MATQIDQLCELPASAEAAPHAAWLADPTGQFARHYNRTSFMFEHDLQRSPMFGLESLIELSRRRPEHPDLAYWSNGRVGVADHWDGARGPRCSLVDTIANIDNNNSLVMLKRVELDTEFGPLLNNLMERIMTFAGSVMRTDVTIGRGTILIASPQRVTSFHIDSDVNFLFQIGGDKSISVFDQTDRTLVTDQELERYYGGDPNGAVFKADRQADGKAYELRAGYGVHIPCMAAHWAQNRGAPSIALSINFDLRSVARVGRLYRLNGRLRRLGLAPRPPGVSAWRDGLKIAALAGLDLARELRRRRPAEGA